MEVEERLRLGWVGRVNASEVGDKIRGREEKRLFVRKGCVEREADRKRKYDVELMPLIIVLSLF